MQGGIAHHFLPIDPGDPKWWALATLKDLFVIEVILNLFC
jgi:hypothetical protein